MSVRNAITSGRFISFFAGIGGSSLGLIKAGYKPVAAVEIDAVRTVELAKKTKVIINDIREVQAFDLPDADLYEADFPVEGFRTYGRRDIDDPRNLLWKEIWRLAKNTRPKTILMTFPVDIVRGRMRGRFLEICDHFRYMKYDVHSKLLNTSHFGVPISKEVVVIIASRDKMAEFLFPRRRYAVKSVKEVLLSSHYTNSDVIEPYEHIKEVMEHLKQGETIGNLDGKLYSYGRCHWDKPARPLIGKVAWNNVSLYHPIENRNISIEEAKLLTGIPLDYFNHPMEYKDKWQCIAQASYPQFYEHLGRAINEV